MSIFKKRHNVLGKNKEIDAIDDFVKHVDYSNAENSDILLEQARSNFRFADNAVEYLEKKADDLIRYLGLGTGLVGILLNYSLCHLKIANKLIILGGFLSWIISIIIAISIRKTSSYFCPAPIDKAIRFMDTYHPESDGLKLWVALAHEKSVIRQGIIGDEKAGKLNTAYVFLVIALGLFFLSFLLKVILP